MNTFEINKIVGALLVAVLTMTIVSFIGNFLIPESSQYAGETVAAQTAPAEPAATPAPPATPAPAGKSETAETPAPTPAEPQEAAAPPAAPAAGIAARLAQADVAAGAKLAKKCRGCHSLKAGGGNKVGPGLWGVVGRAKGSVEGFRYSAGMKAKGGDWSYADLDAFLANTKAFVPKTKMFFKLKNPDDRAALILYLRTLAETPAPLPGR